MTKYTNFDLEQEQLIGYWVKRYGFTKGDLDRHPRIDDVILLIRIREEFKDMNNYNRKRFNKIWNFVYFHKFPLKAKNLQTLKSLAEHTLRKRNRQQRQAQEIRNRRKSVNHTG